MEGKVHPADDPADSSSPLGEESSRLLLRRAQTGDQAALEQLCSRYLPRLRRWASGRLPPHARELLDTDDLVQESFFRTIRRLGSLSPARSASLLAYFHQAILNQIRRQAQRAWRRRLRNEAGDDATDPSPSPLEVTMGREVVRRYEAALAKLDREDREAIIGRIELGCSYAELAELLGKPSPDAARMAVSRALVRLGKEMADGHGKP